MRRIHSTVYWSYLDSMGRLVFKDVKFLYIIKGVHNKIKSPTVFQIFLNYLRRYFDLIKLIKNVTILRNLIWKLLLTYMRSNLYRWALQKCLQWLQNYNICWAIWRNVRNFILIDMKVSIYIQQIILSFSCYSIFELNIFAVEFVQGNEPNYL